MENDKSQTIAIMGASGFVGTNLTLKLLDLGHHVIALSRQPKKWPLQHQNLKVIKGDILSANLEELLKEVSAAYYLVHGLNEEDDNFEYVEAKAALRFTQAANKVKLRKIIYLGGLGPEEDLSSHLRSRHLVGSILGLSHHATVEFRASIVLGAQSTSFEMLKALCHRLPVRPVASWLETPCQPIALDDLMSYLCAALDLEGVGHQVVEIGSPEVVAYGDLMDILLRHEKLTRPKFQIPPLDQRVLLPMLDVVLPEFSQVAKKLFLSLVHPTVVTDNKAEELFPEIKPMGLEEAMQKALETSMSHYPAVWEGDFWKELMELTKGQTKHGQQLLLEKLKNISQHYPEKIMEKLKSKR
jgi:uncharacterized protein YbjT (DUF2867 family)